MLLGKWCLETSLELVAREFRDYLLDARFVYHLKVVESHIGHMAVSDLCPYLSITSFYFEIVE